MAQAYDMQTLHHIIVKGGCIINFKSVCILTKLCPTLVTLWTIAHQAPLSVEFSTQESWSRFPLPPPGDLPDPGIEPMSPALQADSLTAEPSAEPIVLRISVF